jgi:hypothetical protein
MTAADQIRAAIQRCIEANPEPSDGSDIAAAVLYAAAEVLCPEKPEPLEPRPLTPVKAIHHAGEWSAWRAMKAANERLHALAEQLNDTALAQPATTEGPAVLEGREPAAVTGQSVTAEGEVAELVRTLRMEVAAWNGNESATYWLSGPEMTRIADLLERQAAPVPVAVSGWQDIDTAPKDGTEILASDYDAIEIVSWVAPRFDVGITGEWTNREGEAMYPAWWQPLADHPDLPLPSGEDEP